MILYASDLDRTLIYSGRFLEEYPTESEIEVIETKDGRIISYMSSDVKHKLASISSKSDVTFVPVTTRSISEYNRVKLGFTPEYAITSNGGTILYNGVPLKEWQDYIDKNINRGQMLDIIMDIEELDSVDYDVKCIDNCYLFFKTNNEELFDIEVIELQEKYKDYVFTRQRNKCYAIPKHFSKQIALGWLSNKLNNPFIIASGDSELDLPMLGIAHKALVPSHGSLVKDNFIFEGTIIDGGITSPLNTIQFIENKLKMKNE